MNRKITWFFAATMMLLLTACGGGGNGALKRVLVRFAWDACGNDQACLLDEIEDQLDKAQAKVDPFAAIARSQIG